MLWHFKSSLLMSYQIGYLTCDNASNNGTMLREFSRCLKEATEIIWDPIERRIK